MIVKNISPLSQAKEANYEKLLQQSEDYSPGKEKPVRGMFLNRHYKDGSKNKIMFVIDRKIKKSYSISGIKFSL